jgi:hypothetical protein
MPPVDRRNPIRAAASESSMSLMEFMQEYPDDETCLAISGVSVSPRTGNMPSASAASAGGSSSGTRRPETAVLVLPDVRLSYPPVHARVYVDGDVHTGRGRSHADHRQLFWPVQDRRAGSASRRLAQVASGLLERVDVAVQPPRGRLRDVPRADQHSRDEDAPVRLEDYFPRQDGQAHCSQPHPVQLLLIATASSLLGLDKLPQGVHHIPPLRNGHLQALGRLLRRLLRLVAHSGQVSAHG